MPLRRSRADRIKAVESLTVLGSVVGNLLKERRQTLAITESSAGRLIDAAFVAVPGRSAYYLGGELINTGAGRSALLDLTARDIANIRPAGEPVAKLLAQRVRGKLGATWASARPVPAARAATAAKTRPAMAASRIPSRR